MIPLTGLAVDILVPLVIGLFVGLLDGPFWVAGLIISIFYGIVAAIILLFVTLRGASLTAGMLLIGGSLIVLGVVVAYLISLGFASFGFYVGKRISD